MKVKIEQMLYVLIAAIFVGVVMIFAESQVTLTGVTGAFVLVMGIFLRLDLKKMIQDTELRAAGDFEPMRKEQYICGIVLMLALCIEGFILTKVSGKDLDLVYGTLGVGVLMIIGFIVGGIEANKLVTGKKE